MASIGRLVATHYYHHIHLFRQFERGGLALGGRQADGVVSVYLAAMFQEAVNHLAHEPLVPLGVLRGLRYESYLSYLSGGRAVRFQRSLYLREALGAYSPARTPASHFRLGFVAFTAVPLLLIKHRVGPAEYALHFGVGRVA